MADSLQFWWGSIGGNGTTFIISGRFTKIQSATINLKLNDSGTVTLNIDRNDPQLGSFSPIGNTLHVYRNGFVVWSGMIWTMQESYSGPQKTVTLTAIGWYELLNHRLIRTNPGYSKVTSTIALNNAGFESALSGWSGSLISPTRSTAVADTGSASLLISQNNIGQNLGFSNGIASGTGILASTPVAGRRYSLNIRARNRKDPGIMGGHTPQIKIQENGISIASLDVYKITGTNSFYTTGTPAFYGGGSFGGLTSQNVIDTSNFNSYSIEWVSTGFAPTVFVDYDTTCSQLIDGEGFDASYWTVATGGSYSGSINAVGGGIGQLDIIRNSSTGRTAVWTGGWTGTLSASKTYTLTVNYQINTSMPSDGNLSISSPTGVGDLGTIDLVTGTTLGVGRSQSVNFTPGSAGSQPIWISIDLGSTSLTLFMALYNIRITESTTDTDPLLNIDTMTLQEYDGDGIYANQDAGQVAMNLLNKTNADQASGITPGSVEITQPRTITYQQFSNIGQSITALSNIESGFDFWVDPVTRALNIYNRTNATNFPAVAGGQAGAGSFIYSADRTSNLRFDYGVGEDNLSSIQKTTDGSTVVNRLNVQGKYSLGFAEDTLSEEEYLFEDIVSLPDVIDASNSVLPFYAQNEIDFKKNPQISYEIGIKPSQGNSPRLFIDFNIGDRATLRARDLLSGTLTQTIRIFGVQLDVDSQGNERLSGIQMTANS